MVRRRSFARLVFGASALSLLLSCTTDGASGGQSPLTPSRIPPGSATPALFIRACHDSVYGDLGSDWRDGSVVVGPIAFVGLSGVATAKRSDFAPVADGFRSVKALAVVDAGTQVTISISPGDRSHISLLYDPGSFKDFNAYSLEDGQATVRFDACDTGESPFGVAGPTQFNGGFIVDGAQCATIEVASGDDPPVSTHIAFGRGTCEPIG